MTRSSYSSGSPWEEKTGYTRAVRVGNVIEVSGTTSVLNGEIFGEGDMFKQTCRIFDIIIDAVEKLNGQKSDIVRTRMLVTDISKWEEATRAHKLYFKDIKPASTLVGIKALIDPKMLIEIEATAIISNID